jgi:hypothetical protein
MGRSKIRLVVRHVNWIAVVLVIVGGAAWLELFVRDPLYAVILLAAVGGWWDYQRRRSKLKPK